MINRLQTLFVTSARRRQSRAGLEPSLEPIVGAEADPDILNPDRKYVRLSAEQGSNFHYTYLDELEDLLPAKFDLSRGRTLFRGNQANILKSSKLLVLVDSSGNEVTDPSPLKGSLLEPTLGEITAPWFGPIKVSYQISHKRAFRTSKYKATFLCPAETNYLLESRFVARMLDERLYWLQRGFVPAVQVAPFFVIDEILSSFSFLLRKLGLDQRADFNQVASRIESYLEREFASLKLLALVKGEGELVARRLYGISDRLHIAIASIVRVLTESALAGSSPSSDFILIEILNLFPEVEAVSIKQCQLQFRCLNQTESDSEIRDSSDSGLGQQERELIDLANDAAETVRIATTAITSALCRAFPGADHIETIDRFYVNSLEDEATRRDMRLLVQRLIPANAESTHRWCVELLPKALALIARQQGGKVGRPTINRRDFSERA